MGGTSCLAPPAARGPAGRTCRSLHAPITFRAMHDIDDDKPRDGEQVPGWSQGQFVCPHCGTYFAIAMRIELRDLPVVCPNCQKDISGASPN
jgi:hypothetical protein